MNKKQLRHEARKMLKLIPASVKKEMEQQMTGWLFNSSWWKESRVIGITVSTAYEWDTKKIIQQGWREGKVIAVPKCQPTVGGLDFRKLQHFSELECVYQDLWEPSVQKTTEIKKDEIELMLVPGLLFDKKGYRIGYGGGYYDRYLIGFAKETLAIASEKQIIESIPVDRYDLPVKHIVTEKGILF